VLVGEGPLADDVIAEIAGAGLEDRMLLLRDRPDGERLMSQFDVFALSSRYEAGATFVAMEAMRVGTPVVVTDVVGNRDTVENGTAGIVVPPDDGEALADGIVRLLKDPVLRQHMGQAGRARVVARFDVRQAGATLGALYRALATERSA
jgi:glycosyltransferase involved in cell wall biosynthesis